MEKAMILFFILTSAISITSIDAAQPEKTDTAKAKSDNNIIVLTRIQEPNEKAFSYLYLVVGKLKGESFA